ncbi:MAG: hypothetical protein LBQ39_09305 [Tannerellaceae bacterium]|jgi:hypothetical protein|nr:hypothetical protein [Tannerellaceae bacterium]
MKLTIMRNTFIDVCLPGIRCFVLCTFVAGISFAHAQIPEKVFQTPYKIDAERKGALSVELDNLSFFKNNEYGGNFLEGYTLPGLWLQSKAVYYPSTNIKLEAGMHALLYWGADAYPNYAYQDIADWKSERYQYGARLLPVFRAQIALSERVNLVLGNLYGAANHRLIEPLYNPELNLTADPETGLQFLYTSRFIDLDAWTNWESFIFKLDTHQEAFTFGISSRINYNRPESRFHFYTPIQLLTQHRGGEIDTIVVNSVQTFMNGATGIGGVWNINHPVFKRLHVEADATGFYQQTGDLWPFTNGYGLYARIWADLYDFRVKGAYWMCKDFISMFGNPYYGAVSTSEEGLTFDNPRMACFGLEYSRSFGKGYSIGIDLDLYYHLSTTAHTAERTEKQGGATGFSMGVYFRMIPSFLIKRF